MLINDLFSSLISLQKDWKGIVLNPNFVRKGWIISWSNFGSLSVGDNLTTRTILEWGKSRQYSFQLDDGSLLQLYYEFQPGGEVLENASVAFYKFKDGQTQALEDIGEWTGEEIWSDSDLEDDLLVPWVRVDCCPQHRRGVIHSAIHMHSNIGPSVRIPVNGFPTPKQFLEVIIAWFYPEKYASRHLDTSGGYENMGRVQAINRQSIPCFDDPNARRIVYLDMPKSE